MFRILVFALLGYGAYRLAKNVMNSVPSDFEPLLLEPPSEESDHV